MADTISITGYTIQSLLGEGGLATVYLAEGRRFRRDVALKVMSPLVNADRGFTVRFVREARLLAQLDHPSIVPIFEVGEHDGLNFFSMEYLPGGSLRRRLTTEAGDATLAVNVCTALCGALDGAHARGFLHRDIKPENVLFREDGTPVLTDFGLARALDGHAPLTGSGMLVGSPTYMSPEQVKGLDLDGRSDLYSVGILFHEILTGRPPFVAGVSLLAALKHFNEPLPRLPPEHARYQDFVDQLASRDRSERFATGAEVVRALGELIPRRRLNGAAGAPHMRLDTPAQSPAEAVTASAGSSVPSQATATAVPRPAARTGSALIQVLTLLPLAAAAGCVAVGLDLIVTSVLRSQPPRRPAEAVSASFAALRPRLERMLHAPASATAAPPVRTRLADASPITRTSLSAVSPTSPGLPSSVPPAPSPSPAPDAAAVPAAAASPTESPPASASAAVNSAGAMSATPAAAPPSSPSSQGEGGSASVPPAARTLSLLAPLSPPAPPVPLAARAMRSASPPDGASPSQPSASVSSEAPRSVSSPDEDQRARNEADAHASQLQTQELEIRELLATAARQDQAGALWQPAGACAADSYRTVLSIQPALSDALAGLQRIAAVLATEIAYAEDTGDSATAGALLQQLTLLAPAHPQLAALQARLQTLPAGGALSSRDSRQLARAQESVTRAGTILDASASTAATESATQEYDSAQQARPGTPGMALLRERLILAYTAAVRGALAAGDSASALRLLQKARAHGFRNADLDQLEVPAQAAAPPAVPGARPPL